MSGCFLITGAGSGIGAATSRALAAAGHRVLICGRDQGRLEETARGADRISWRVCDVSDRQAVAALFEWVGQQAERLDGVANAAGLFGAIGPVAETDPERWLYTINTMIGGSYLVSRSAVPLLLASESPRILNFAGGGAFDPFPHYSAYAVSKAAIVRLTETMAVELAGTPIRVNAVAPGFVATRIHEATLEAGERAPEGHVARTREVMASGAGVPIETAVACATHLLAGPIGPLTGKTISASFDPWEQPGFLELAPQINESALYTMKRVNPPQLEDEQLRDQVYALYQAKHGKPTFH